MGHDEAYTYAALLVLAYGRTEPGSILSAYQVVREADGTDRFTQTQIFSTAASPTQMRDESGTNWWFEAYLLPVKKGERYGVALLGNEAKEQYFSGMTGVFFALRNTTLSNK
jgi:hypothetical protein